MSSSRGTPSSCAQIRGWTLDWWTDWCCSWTGSTPRYSVTRKPTGSLQIIYDTLTNKQKHPVLTVIMSLHLNLLNWIWTVFRYVQWFNSACGSLQFRNLSVPTKVRLAELLKHLHGKGEEACNEFYRGLHIHAEDVYSSLPTRVIQRGKNTAQSFSDVLVAEHCWWEPCLLKHVVPQTHIWMYFWDVCR